MRGAEKKPISQIPLERTWHGQQVDFLPGNLLPKKERISHEIYLHVFIANKMIMKSFLISIVYDSYIYFLTKDVSWNFLTYLLPKTKSLPIDKKEEVTLKRKSSDDGKIPKAETDY